MEKKKTQTPAPTASLTEESPVQTPVSEPQGKLVKNFTAYLTPEVVYGEDAALDVLRVKLRGYKEIHAGFLAKTEEKDAFTLKREYIPVYRQSAVVDYAWKVRNKGEKVSHNETREVACRQQTAPEFFRADVFPADVKTITLAAPKKSSELYPCKGKTFAACMDSLKKEAKAFAPQKGAKMQLSNRRLEILYVPVLKATCVYEGKEYVGYVNMVNGECDAQYRVSDRLIAKADKTMRRVETARTHIAFALIYALTFVGLTLFQTIRTETVQQTLPLMLCMGCAVLPMLISYIGCFSYKRDKLILKTVKTGKLPKATLPAVLATMSALLAIAEMLVFAIYVL